MNKKTGFELLDQVYLNFKEEAELFFVKKFVDNNAIAKVYKNCLDIFFNVTKTVDSTKGTMLRGKYGQGKSFIFDVINHRNKRRKGKNKFFITTAKELCDIYVNSKDRLDPMSDLRAYINVRELLIDDVGEELKEGRDRIVYGNRLNVIRYVLLHRYEKWTKTTSKDIIWRTHITTNLSTDQIAENYGGRVADRVKHMMHDINFQNLKNGSFRQMEGTRRLNSEEVAESWSKFIQPEKKEVLDLEKFFNEELTEPLEYFEGKDNSYWSFLRDYLERKKMISEVDYDKISVELLDAARVVLRRDVRETNLIDLKNATAAHRANALDRKLEEITGGKIMECAKNIMARNRFLELKKENHVFV